MNLECNHVVQTMNEILEEPKYEGIVLEAVRCKNKEGLPVDTLSLKFPEENSKMMGRAGDIARKLNSALEIKDEPRYKPTNYIGNIVNIHLVNHY